MARAAQIPAGRPGFFRAQPGAAVTADVQECAQPAISPPDDQHVPDSHRVPSYDDRSGQSGRTSTNSTLPDTGAGPMPLSREGR